VGWDQSGLCRSGALLFDLTSLVGGDPVEVTPRAIVDAWQEGLEPVQAVRHQTGTFVISIDCGMATASCYGTATHFRPEQEQRVISFVGTSDFHLIRMADGWKIDSLKIDAKYVE
jgi:hypothetical protein